LVHKRNSNRWDFPGGGIDGAETLADALRRELLEELGISEYEILMESKLTYKYDWPESEREKNFKKSGTWKRGQEQHFFVIRVIEDKVVIKLQEVELTEYKWVPYDEIRQNMSYKDQFEYIARVFGECGVSLPAQI
jgi:8-oxo-dGTP pyrophosphatase MutT (NUDIX family)